MVAKSDGHGRSRERYLLYSDKELVARISSVVGLATALRSDTSDGGDGAVSLAGVLEGADWLRAWADEGRPRIVEVLEKDRQRRVRLHVARLIDPLLSGETYEAMIENAEIVEP